MNCPHSTTEDILDFASLAQEAVKVMQREERVRSLSCLAHTVLCAKNYGFPPSVVTSAKFAFLSEV